MDWLALAEGEQWKPQHSSDIDDIRSQASVSLASGAQQGLTMPAVPAPGDDATIPPSSSYEDGRELVLTVEDLIEGEKRLPPPTSSMKMGCPKIPQVGSVNRYSEAY